MNSPVSPIFINDSGGSGPLIVGLHGFMATSSYWNRLASVLIAAGYRVVTIDLLGFGRAAKPDDADYTYEVHVEHVRHTLRLHSITAPFILMGHSMGALIAARYAARFPEDITRTILLHPPLYASRTEARTVLRQSGSLYRFLLDSRFRGIGWGLLRQLKFAIASHTRASRERSLRHIIEAAELLRDLRVISRPTLLVNGTRDRRIYRHNLRFVPRRPQVHVRSQPVNHHSPLTHPNLIGRMIIEFIRSQRHAPAS
jgi:cis-3-alkyl-4-acyloxetan-2-one decarboxylase